MRGFFAWIQRYERHLSAGAMLAGFVFDNLFFSRIDAAETHIVFIAYLAIAAGAILGWHYLEEYSAEGSLRPKWHSVLPILIQFALGGLWSGFLIFYSRSATLASSWAFLLILGAMFLGNELFRRYHARLVFNASLYFFALYSYAIFAVPLLTHSIGQKTFLLSGGVALAVFACFVWLLKRSGRFRFLKSVWQIRLSAVVILLLMNAFYFMDILPPLPLALAEGGMYHSLMRVPGGYQATREAPTWRTSLGIPPTLHAPRHGSLVAFAAVFAPVELSTDIVHEWQRYDSEKRSWQTKLRVSYPIAGGREGGYRGYSTLRALEEGSWRVSIKTVDGRLVGRLRFELAFGENRELETIRL